MFLTIDNTAEGFDPEFKNLKEYDFFFLTSNIEDDCITLSDEASFKLFNDVLHCSLIRKKPVFILKNSIEFKKEWIELVSSKDSLIHDEFIFINPTIKSEVKSLIPKDNGKLSLSMLSSNYAQL